MSKKVCITADSPIDLSKDLLERFDISTISLHINLDGNDYCDGVDITSPEMFKIYNEKKVLPKTSAVSVAEYIDFFKSFIDNDCEVVHFSLSSCISSTHQNACIAASELEGVYVVDTLSLSAGIALLAIKGCEMRDAGISAEEINQKILSMRELSQTSFVLDTLEFMKKGGRCSSIVALGANILGIKPGIDMNNGSLGVGKKYRGKLESVHLQYLEDKITDLDNIDLDRAFINHTGISEEHLKELTDILLNKYKFKEVLTCFAGCTIASHCGPKTMGVLFMRKHK